MRLDSLAEQLAGAGVVAGVSCQMARQAWDLIWYASAQYTGAPRPDS